MLECLKSVIVAGVALVSSRPEVNHSKAALAGSVVFVDVVVLEPGLAFIEPALDVEFALLSAGSVEFDDEVSQLSAAFAGFRTPFDGTALGVVDDCEVADAVLLSDCAKEARNCGVDSDKDISSSRSSSSAQVS